VPLPVTLSLASGIPQLAQPGKTIAMSWSFSVPTDCAALGEVSETGHFVHLDSHALRLCVRVHTANPRCCCSLCRNQKARDFFTKNKQQLDGKIPEKYNSRTAKLYQAELLV
jgi:hypothetical protein